MTLIETLPRPPVLRVRFTADDLRDALAVLGPPGDRAEALVWAAATALEHQLRGGTMTYEQPS